jgi:hypothetical protein
MTDPVPGPDVRPSTFEPPTFQPSTIQAGAPDGPWAPPQAGEAVGPPSVPARKRFRPTKLVRLGVLAVAAVIGLGTSTGWFGNSDPKVGDCVRTTGQTSFDVVDCGKAGAQYKIVGIDATKRTYAAFLIDDTVCAAFSSSEEALWVGDDKTASAAVYCAEPLAGVAG